MSKRRMFNLFNIFWDWLKSLFYRKSKKIFEGKRVIFKINEKEVSYAAGVEFSNVEYEEVDVLNLVNENLVTINSKQLDSIFKK